MEGRNICPRFSASGPACTRKDVGSAADEDGGECHGSSDEVRDVDGAHGRPHVDEHKRFRQKRHLGGWVYGCMRVWVQDLGCRVWGLGARCTVKGYMLMV